MSANIFSHILIFIVIASGLGISLWSFIGNKKNTVNQLFFIFVNLIMLNIFFSYLFKLQMSDSLTLLWAKMIWVTTSLLIPAFYYFAVYFPKKVKSYRILDVIFVLTGVVLTVLTLFSGIFIKAITYGESGPDIVTGVGINYFYGILVLAILSGFCILLLKYLKFTQKEKVKIKYFIFGIAIFVVSEVIFGILLPVLFKNNKLNSLGDYSAIFFIAFTAYAIVRHRLMDIRMVVARSVAYIILLVTLAGIYAASVIGFERIFFPDAAGDTNIVLTVFRTFVAVAMVFLFQPIRKWITNATDRVFFKNQYDPEQLLSEISHTIGSTIVLIEMLYKINDLLVKNLKISRSAFVLFKNDDELYTSQSIGYKGWPPVDIPDFIHMTKKGTIVYDELEENSVYRKLLKKYDASIMMPIHAEEKGIVKLIGVFLAGEKSSGDMFTQQDIQILEILAPEVAIGIENAKSFEEISRFNVTLREEIKRATKKLKNKNDELRELDKAKDEFISMASHQLRTPLTAIKGYLSMLLEGDAGEIRVSQYDFINEAYSAAGRMVGLINDLLNVSRMETGRFFLEPKEVDIERIVDEEVKQLQNHAREKGLYLKIEAKGKVPHIWADETKIRQVVMNFIDNAIYYTQTGGVTIKLTKDTNDFIFKVVDTGIGVPKAQQAHLFEKFFRADNARQARPDGTGLGIYLAKRVTQDHGGKVIFESEEGKGSTFGFTFPLKKVLPKLASAPMPNTPAAPALSSAAADFNEKTVGLEPPVATHPETEIGKELIKK